MVIWIITEMNRIESTHCRRNYEIHFWITHFDSYFFVTHCYCMNDWIPADCEQNGWKSDIDTEFHRPEEDKSLKEISRRMGYKKKLATRIQENAGLYTWSIGKWGSSLLDCEEGDTIRKTLGSVQRLLSQATKDVDRLLDNTKWEDSESFTHLPQKNTLRKQFSRFMGPLTAIHKCQWWTILATIGSRSAVQWLS